MNISDPVHVDKLAYAVSLLGGAARIASTAKDQHIKVIGIPFYLLIGFSVENGLKALLEFQHCGGNWKRSHNLADLLSKAKGLEERLLHDIPDMVRHLSRYHEEFWFRYPEKAAIAEVYSATTTLFMTDYLLKAVADLTGGASLAAAPQ